MKYECESRCFNYPLKCHECKSTSDIYNPDPCFLDRNSDLVKQIKAEAIKEFAERLDRKFAFSSDTQCISAKTIRKFIQDELKEMVGE